MSNGSQELEEMAKWIVEKSKPLYIKGYLNDYANAPTWDLYFVRPGEQPDTFGQEDSVKVPRQSRDHTPEGLNQEKNMVVERLIKQREGESDRAQLVTLLTIKYEPPGFTS